MSLFRFVKVKLLSLVVNVLVSLVVDDDIVTNCDQTPHAGWICVFHETDNDVAQISFITISSIDRGPVAWMNFTI